MAMTVSWLVGVLHGVLHGVTCALAAYSLWWDRKTLRAARAAAAKCEAQ